MSYDIYFYTDAGNGPVNLDIGDFNYTYNLGNFFEWLLGKRLGDYNGLDAYELMSDIKIGFNKLMRANYAEYQHFNPDNGWGHVVTATALLGQIGMACAKAPNAKVGVC